MGLFLAGTGERWKRYCIHVGFPTWLVTQRLSRVSLIPILDLAYRMKVMQRAVPISRYGRATRHKSAHRPVSPVDGNNLCAALLMVTIRRIPSTARNGRS